MSPEEALRDYPARAWHGGARALLCLPCADLFGHLLPGGLEALAPYEGASAPCDLHLDPSRMPCTVEEASEIPSPDDAERAAEYGDAPRRDVAEARPSGYAGGMSDAPESKPAPKPPRFRITFVPAANQEAEISIEASEEGVTAAEIAFYASKVVTKLVASGGQRIPTTAELERDRAEREFVAAHPATRLWVRDGKQLWLGGSAPTPPGWTDAGPVPDGVKRACDWERDPDGFAARVSPPLPGAKQAAETPEA